MLVAVETPLTCMLHTRTMPPECQMLLFSATYPEQVSQLARRVVPNPNMLYLRREEIALNAIRQYAIRCRDVEHKTEVLSSIYGLLTVGSSMIFCEVRRGDAMLWILMRALPLSAPYRRLRWQSVSPSR